MINIHIVLIGTYPDFPSIESINNSKQICERNNFKLFIYLIDVKFFGSSRAISAA